MKTTLLLSLCMLLFPCAELGATAPVRIEGQIPEIAEGEMLLLAQSPTGVDTLGRAAITNGAFTLEATLEEAFVATLRVAGYEGGFLMIAEPGATYRAELYQAAPSSIRGGRQQEELLAYQQRIAVHNERLRELNGELERATKEQKFRTASELRKQLSTAGAEAREELGAILERNRGSVFAAYIITGGMRRGEQEAMRECYAALSEEERNSQPGRIVASFIAGLERLDVGSKAPDFSLPTPDGQQVSLYGLEGRLKIIDFWASWCGPCRMENPNVVALYDEYKDRGLTIVSVSLDEKREAWLRAIADDGMEWVHVSSLEGWKSSVVERYNIDAVPTIYILDGNNRILAKNLRGEQLREFVAARLK